ncbi:adenosylcobinamide-phosphate synthase CbiB [Alkalitalea saponilacus]|uniref:Cobalamin biosynthesis protein CobD n=1 Tax=Alkalitalea saponilacus TaxID=889453 RepID=A0A1T5BUP4_9BACT|nr:adenosylcobinamide-phosphate synthase CbiB [Alkalitalea saponilacus]ASB49600.1 cobalamin biosynthesis protein CobD [Alkalitalea saponilacus]SKB50570.1 adenosylcobinamide-phosphate synthase [Alkalitalea saponilacus]
MDSESILVSSSPYLIPLLVGYLLDLVFGDPYRMPHPVKLFGRLIAYGESVLNKNRYRFLKGMLMVLLLVGVTWASLLLFFFAIQNVCFVWYPVASLFVFWGLANRSLIDEARKVEYELSMNGLEAGRHQLSYIVGRDTSNLSPQQIRTATLETLSENLSDGVIAPLFYYAIGGIPLMFAYKMVNTLDSMVGYKNERYIRFGKFAARLDDVANFIPARLTAIIMAVVSASKNAFLFIRLYRKNHSSPNAGWPESALAGILNCRFGGPNLYHGKMVEKPYIGKNNREITSPDIDKACWVNHKTTIVMVVLTALVICCSTIFLSH